MFCFSFNLFNLTPPPPNLSFWFCPSPNPYMIPFDIPLLQSTLYRGMSRKDKPRGRPHGLTQQKKQEIKEAFELFDTDGSGNDKSRANELMKKVIYS